jgi:hypothetical protein
MTNKGNMPGSLPKINPKTCEVFAKHTFRCQDLTGLNPRSTMTTTYPPEPFRIKVTEPNELLVV